MKKLVSLILALAMLSLAALTLAEEALPDGTLYKSGQSETDMNADAENFEAGEMPNIVYFDSLSSLLMALKAGRIGRMFVLQPTAEYIHARNGDIAVSYASPFDVLLSMGVREDDGELLEALNAAIASLADSGEIAALYEDCMAGIADDPVPAALPRVEGARTVRVAATGDLPPLDYVSAAGEAAGFNIQLLSAIGTLANINFELVLTDAGSRAAMLSSGRADVIFWMETAIQSGENGEAVFFAESADGLALTDAYAQVVGVSMILG